MKIGVIVPVINNNFLPGLLDCIERNTVHPDSIIIIDNSPDRGIVIQTRLFFHKIMPDIPLGVNASWNTAVPMLFDTTDMISILNDDLLLEDHFFEKLIDTARLYPEAGVLCPNTLKDEEGIKHAFQAGNNNASRMNRREGWAWTIRSEVAKRIPPIPSDLVTFCGDDWYWHHCHKLNRPWMKMITNYCYHYGSQSVRLTGVEKDLRSEKNIFATYL
jgi:GT2 family glycosyltransferase